MRQPVAANHHHLRCQGSVGGQARQTCAAHAALRLGALASGSGHLAAPLVLPGLPRAPPASCQPCHIAYKRPGEIAAHPGHGQLRLPNEKRPSCSPPARHPAFRPDTPFEKASPAAAPVSSERRRSSRPALGCPHLSPGALPNLRCCAAGRRLCSRSPPPPPPTSLPQAAAAAKKPGPRWPVAPAMAPHEKPPFRVEALLPAPASSYFLERDSAAFRSLLSKVRCTRGLCPKLLPEAAAQSFCCICPQPLCCCAVLTSTASAAAAWSATSSLRGSHLHFPFVFAVRADAEDWAAGVPRLLARGHQHVCEDRDQARIWQLGAWRVLGDCSRMHGGCPPAACGHPRCPRSQPVRAPSPPCPLYGTQQVPKSVASQLQSSNLEFIDIIEYNPAFISAAPYRIFVRTESPFLKEKLDVRMTMTIEEAEGGTACRQVWRGEAVMGILPSARTEGFDVWVPRRGVPSSAVVRSLQLATVHTHCSLGSRLQQILEGHIRVKMFGVGRIVEGIVKDSLQNVRCVGGVAAAGVGPCGMNLSSEQSMATPCCTFTTWLLGPPFEHTADVQEAAGDCAAVAAVPGGSAALR